MTTSTLSTSRLQQLIAAQMTTLVLSPQAVISRMGYQSNRYEQACERLQQVLHSDSLGLGDGYYDFKYDGKGFVAALCCVLDVASAQYQPVLKSIEADLQQRADYRLRAKISFEPDGASAISLMAFNRFIYQDLPTNFYLMDEAEQNHIAQEYAQAHYQLYGHDLPYAGRISGYDVLRKRKGEQSVALTIPIAN
ncbi:hypothetical protein KRX19_01475 [Cardiobacteriaceae bacterium TAE3-ERU3]|nr:hypothetical protein [Cardiobacteriaceae bacterium TAE3-ERU3]